MAVILINPNSTKSMTDSALAAARRAAPDITFHGKTSYSAPAAIEGAEDGARATPVLLELVRSASEAGADAIIIACFDDTGLDQARAIARCPVIGIGQASYVMAGLMVDRAAVITTVAAALPVIRANVAAQDHSALITEIRAADVPVLMLDHDPTGAAARFIATANGLDQTPDLVILGCSGAVTIVPQVAAALPYPVLDGVSCAARLCRALAT